MPVVLAFVAAVVLIAFGGIFSLVPGTRVVGLALVGLGGTLLVLAVISAASFNPS